MLGALDVTGLSDNLFIPVSELNHLRQTAIEELTARRDWSATSSVAERQARVDAAVSAVDVTCRPERSEG